MFEITEMLRGKLEMARAQHQTLLKQSKQPGLRPSEYVARASIAEYQRGRADGLRMAIETLIAARRHSNGN